MGPRRAWAAWPRSTRLQIQSHSADRPKNPGHVHPTSCCWSESFSLDCQSQCHGERDSENRCPRVPAPSNMLRQRCRWCGGVVGTKELSLLRHTLAEPPSCRFIEDLTGDLLGARARIGTRRHSRHRLCGIIAAWAGGGGEKTLGFWWTRY